MGGGILVVEPNTEEAGELEEGLRTHGIAAPMVHAVSCADARKILTDNLAETSPEVLVIAFSAQASEEYDFVRWMRSHPVFFDIVVIGLGRWQRHADAQVAYSSGVNAYFIKGAGLEPLVRTLNALTSMKNEISNSADHPAFRDATDGGCLQAKNPLPVLFALPGNHEARLFENAWNLLKLRNPLRFVQTIAETRQYLEGVAPYEDRSKYPKAILLFMDLRLSESQAMLAWLESHPERRPTGIVAVTNSHDMRLVIQAYHLGVNSFVKLPPKTEELQNSLTAVRKIRICQGDAGKWIEEEI